MTHLARNPVAQRELRFLRRKWWLVLMIALLAWVPLQWLVRSLWDIGGPVMGFWQSIATYTLILMYRPDLLFAFVIVAAMASETRWWQSREEFAVTTLSGRELAFGMAIGPLILLALLHIAMAPVAYRTLLTDSTYEFLVYWQAGASIDWFPPTQPGQGILLNAAWLVIPFAILEDIFYAALALLVAMNQFLLRRDTWRAAFWAFLQMTIVSAGIAACSFVYYAVTWAISDEFFVRLMMTPPLDFLVGNASWFGSVLPYQLLLIWYFWRRLARRLDGEFLDPAERE